MNGIQQFKPGHVGRPGHATDGQALPWPRLTLVRPEPGLLLKETVAQRIVPHLLNLHPRPRPEPVGISHDDIEALAQLAARGDFRTMLASIEALIDAGTPADLLCLDVLAPAARHLGEMWERDEYDFTEVTIGVAHLHQAMRRLSPTAPASRRGLARAPSILMVPVPGEQHQFGLAMAAGFFQRAGWSVVSGMSPQLEGLRALVRARHFDVVGFSASSERNAEMLARALRSVRQSSRNPHLVTMVGGSLFVANPTLAIQLGADAVAVDGAQAPVQAADLLLNNADQRVAQIGPLGLSASSTASGEPGSGDRRAPTPSAGSRDRQPRSRNDQEDRVGGG